MIYFALFIIPFIFLINSYLLGCLVKRWSRATNTYICSVIGFFIFTSILFILFVLLYISSANIIGYLILIVSVQTLLIIIYVWNYRYIFLTRSFKVKPLICFIAIVALTSLTAVLIIIYGYKMKTPESMEFAGLVNNFNNHNFYNNFTDVIVFYGSQFNFQFFSVFSVFAVTFKHFLSIKDADLNIYLYFQQILTLSVMLGWTITGFAYKIINRNKAWYIIVATLSALFILVLATMFYESPIVGDSWITIPIILYAYTTFNRNEANEQYYANLNIAIILGISGLDVNLCLLSIMLYLFHFLYNCIRNFNAWGHLIYALFPLLFTLFVWIPLISPIVYTITLSLMLVGSILVCIFYWRIHNSNISAKINVVFNKHPTALLITVVAIIYLFSIILFFTVFERKFNWILWPEKIYETIWGWNLANTNFNFIMNIASWVCIATFSIVLMTCWLFKSFRFINQPYLMLSGFSILLFLNPLSLNMFSRFQQMKINLFDFGLINYLLIIPLLAYLLNLIGNITIGRRESPLYGQSINKNQQS